MKINRIDHIAVTVKDVEKTLDFYTRVLGMEHEMCDGVQHALRFGHQKINLHTYKGEFQPAAQCPEYGSQDLCFIVDDDIEDVKADIESKGVEIVEGIIDQEGALGLMKSIYFRDPDGNLIELAEYCK
ncbi:MAG: VOC family protein [Bacillota bacterium]|nr:VOC family protein [Bacillota bacterium]